jgi:tRNA pseudouridine13 synthase
MSADEGRGSPGAEVLPAPPAPGFAARAWPAVITGGRIRVLPEDFRVDEELGFEPSGAGAHRLLRIRKRGANTGWVAMRLARLLGVRTGDVGYAGLKDRHAVTEQWFSVPAAAPHALSEADLAADGLAVVEAHAHDRKLRPGSHRANRFRIVVRDVRGDPDAIDGRLTEMGERGVPNAFGPQRFGRGGHNLELARALAAGRRMRRADRGFALSAARSLIFNEALSRRVAAGEWDALVPGDRAGLAGSRSHFAVDVVDATLTARVASHDVHPTGPLWGRGDPPTRGPIRRLEEDAAAAHATLRELLERSGMRQERRPLRLSVEDLDWGWEGTNLTLAFRLVAGGFATAVLVALG